MTYCVACGQALEPGQRFCTACGVPQAGGPAPGQAGWPAGQPPAGPGGAPGAGPGAVPAWGDASAGPSAGPGAAGPGWGTDAPPPPAGWGPEAPPAGPAPPRGPGTGLVVGGVLALVVVALLAALLVGVVRNRDASASAGAGAAGGASPAAAGSPGAGAAGAGAASSGPAGSATGPASAAGSAPTDPVTVTATATPTPTGPEDLVPGVDDPPASTEALGLPEALAARWLAQLRREDASAVAALDGVWVAQVSSKCAPLVQGVDMGAPGGDPGYPDGVAERYSGGVGSARILAYHLAMRERFGDVLLAVPGDLGTGSTPSRCDGEPLWVSVVEVDGYSADGTLAWCGANDLPVNECAARPVGVAGESGLRIQGS